MGFKRYRKLSIHFPKPSVSVDSSMDRADATVPFALVRDQTPFPDLKDLYNDPDSWLEQVDRAADLFLLKLWFVKTDGDWLVAKARLRSPDSRLPK